MRMHRPRRTDRPRQTLRRSARITLVAVGATLVAGVVSTVAGADPSVSDWAALRQCESSGNYQAVASNGHYGAYQFDIPTWRSVGGTGMPNHASRGEQDYRALYLYRMRGWQPWECANRSHLNLHGDSDAASGDAPSRAESRYMSQPPSSAPSPPPGMPAWDGLVYFKGDCSASLRTFQLRMNAIGSPYHFQGTGCYHTHTYRAVVALQKANGINPSGRLGPKTWHAAWKGTSPF